jgi:hypothetical protein
VVTLAYIVLFSFFGLKNQFRVNYPNNPFAQELIGLGSRLKTRSPRIPRFFQPCPEKAPENYSAP